MIIISIIITVYYNNYHCHCSKSQKPPKSSWWVAVAGVGVNRRQAGDSHQHLPILSSVHSWHQADDHPGEWSGRWQGGCVWSLTDQGHRGFQNQQWGAATRPQVHSLSCCMCMLMLFCPLMWSACWIISALAGRHAVMYCVSIVACTNSWVWWSCCVSCM